MLLSCQATNKSHRIKEHQNSLFEQFTTYHHTAPQNCTDNLCPTDIKLFPSPAIRKIFKRCNSLRKATKTSKKIGDHKYVYCCLLLEHEKLPNPEQKDSKDEYAKNLTTSIKNLGLYTEFYKNRVLSGELPANCSSYIDHMKKII